ncbi:hypothetical protein, partial [Vibrio vulnificus]|uniref:hypothetical protein n=1 Tax=Vibrio vulnificus TaxID=672 RepID=UPI001EEA5FA3
GRLRVVPNAYGGWNRLFNGSKDRGGMEFHQRSERGLDLLAIVVGDDNPIAFMNIFEIHHGMVVGNGNLCECFVGAGWHR